MKQNHFFSILFFCNNIICINLCMYKFMYCAYAYVYGLCTILIRHIMIWSSTYTHTKTNTNSKYMTHSASTNYVWQIAIVSIWYAYTIALYVWVSKLQGVLHKIDLAIFFERKSRNDETPFKMQLYIHKMQLYIGKKLP